MVADIVAVWTGRGSWARVQARDHQDHQIKPCCIWMGEDIGRWLASLCKQAKGPVVLTVKPPNALGEYEIENAELMP